MKVIISVIILALMVLPSVGAEIIYENRCYGSILAREANFSMDTDEYQLNNTMICEYGCDSVTNTCKPPEYAGWVWAGVFVLVIFGIIGAILKFG